MYLPMNGLIEVCKRKIEHPESNRNYLDRRSLNVPDKSALYEHGKKVTVLRGIKTT